MKIYKLKIIKMQATIQVISFHKMLVILIKFNLYFLFCNYTV